MKWLAGALIVLALCGVVFVSDAGWVELDGSREWSVFATLALLIFAFEFMSDDS